MQTHYESCFSPVIILVLVTEYINSAKHVTNPCCILIGKSELFRSGDFDVICESDISSRSNMT